MDTLRALSEMSVGRTHPWRPFTPNWLTIYGAAGTILGFFISLFLLPVTGFVIGTFWAFFDLFDGLLARLLGRSLEGKHGIWTELNFPGLTRLGEILDPLADKVKHVVTYGVLVWKHLINLPLTILMFIPDILATLMRWPFGIGAEYLGESRANWIGKAKTWIQWGPILSALCEYHSWFTDSWIAQVESRNQMLIVCIAFSWASFLSKLQLPTKKRTP